MLNLSFFLVYGGSVILGECLLLFSIWLSVWPLQVQEDPHHHPAVPSWWQLWRLGLRRAHHHRLSQTKQDWQGQTTSQPTRLVWVQTFVPENINTPYLTSQGLFKTMIHWLVKSCVLLLGWNKCLHTYWSFSITSPALGQPALQAACRVKSSIKKTFYILGLWPLPLYLHLFWKYWSMYTLWSESRASKSYVLLLQLSFTRENCNSCLHLHCVR